MLGKRPTTESQSLTNYLRMSFSKNMTCRLELKEARGFYKREERQRSHNHCGGTSQIKNRRSIKYKPEKKDKMYMTRCPSTEEWIRKMWFIYTMEYYAAEKNNDFMKFSGKWMELEIVTLSECSTMSYQYRAVRITVLNCGITKLECEITLLACAISMLNCDIVMLIYAPRCSGIMMLHCTKFSV
ncbi:hypothetical protein STEG23_029194 [Scotinomys teguina]